METRFEQIKRLKDNRMSYAKIGKLFGISRQRIHQILSGYKSPGYFKRVSNKSEIKLKKIKEVIFKNLPDGDLYKITNIKSCSRDQYRELIRIRDKYTCQICGRIWNKGERRFDVHHLDEDSLKTRQIDNLLTEAENMVTLCHKCHLNLPGYRDKMRKSKAGDK